MCCDIFLGETYRDYHSLSSATTTAAEMSSSYIASAVCTDEFNMGSFCGTGGMVSSTGDMHIWYTALFLDLNTDILSEESVAAIIYPTTPTGCSNVSCNYFCQGIGTENNIGDINPIVIYYTGNMYCTATSMRLLMETASEPALLAMAFLNSVIVNATSVELDASMTTVVGTFFEIAYEIYQWETYGETRDIVEALGDYFRANPRAISEGGRDDKDDSFETTTTGIIVIVCVVVGGLVIIMLCAFVYMRKSGSTSTSSDATGGGATKSPLGDHRTNSDIQLSKA
jgi:hypothetical protein